MKRTALVITFFCIGIIVSPFVPFVLAYMAANGDYDCSFDLK